MKKTIILTDGIIKKYICSLREQERSENTVKSYNRELLSLQLYLDDKPITKDKLLSYKTMIALQYAPSTCNVSIAAINSMLKYLCRPDLTLAPLKIQKQIFEPEDRELTRKDYDRLIRAANLNGQDRLSLIIQTICSTGIRVSELQYITVEAAKEGKCAVNNKGKSRIVFIPAQLQKLLKKYVVKQNITAGSIFVSRNGKPLDRSNIYHSMQRLCSIAGVKPSKVYPHNLRHLFAKTYYTQNKDISRLADILALIPHVSIHVSREQSKQGR